MKFSKEIKVLFTLYFFISLIKFSLSFLVPYPQYFGDERLYVDLGRNFLKSGQFFVDEKPFNHYPPLYSITISFATLIDIRTGYIVMKAINSFLSSFIVFPMYMLSKEFLNKKESILLSFLSLFLVEGFVYSYTIMSENIFYPLFLFSIYCFYKSLYAKNNKFKILTGIFVGLSILSRTIGLILIFILVLTLFIHFIIKEKKSIVKYYFTYRLTFLIILLIILPWYLRNIYYFGTNLTQITGYNELSKSTIERMTIFKYIYFALINIGYLALGTGLIFFIFSLYSIKQKDNFDFKIIFIVTAILFILLCSFWSFTEGGAGEKIMGRYMGPVSYLILIAGSIGLKNFEIKKNHNLILYVSMITFIVLFFIPIDKKMGGFDSPSTIFLITPKQAFLMNVIPILIPDLFIKLVIISLPFILFVFRKHITFKNAFLFTIIFLIINTLIATVAFHYGSLDAKDFMELALWMKDNLSSGRVILDIQEPNQERSIYFWIQEALKFWTNFKIIKVNFDDEIDSEYVISYRNLPLKLIKSIKTVEGIYHKKTIELFLYEV